MIVHHIGYLVKNIDKSIKEFENIGYIQIKDKILDRIRNVYISFMQNEEYIIELVSPVNKESEIYSLLKKYKNTPYHICYETANIMDEIKKLRKNGYMLIQDVKEAPAIDNRKVAFLINQNIGILELIE